MMGVWVRGWRDGSGGIGAGVGGLVGWLEEVGGGVVVVMLIGRSRGIEGEGSKDGSLENGRYRWWLDPEPRRQSSILHLR